MFRFRVVLLLAVLAGLISGLKYGRSSGLVTRGLWPSPETKWNYAIMFFAGMALAFRMDKR